MSLATPIPLERLCRLGLVSRAGFYRWRNASEAVDPDLDLRDEIQRIALEFPYYGWPRVTRELADRGWRVDLSPELRQTVKTQFSANGELGHGNATEVHEGI
jgi:hypothetical protein